MFTTLTIDVYTLTIDVYSVEKKTRKGGTCYYEDILILE